MMLLRDILYKVSLETIQGNTAIDINKIEFDSRQIAEGDVFVAIKGKLTDGHHYIKKAVKLGAIAVVCEILPSNLNNEVTYIQVKDSQQSLALMASNYYENPSENLKLVGITGTNGKTTIASLLYQLFQNAGYTVGLLSTVKIMVANKEFATSHTTPDSLTINRYLAAMSKEGVEFCFMEVSSHGIAQKRVEGLTFAGGAFTNLSHDHLDYHKSFKEYRDVKKQFFDRLPPRAFALTNADDKNGDFMLQNCKAKKYKYALKSYADYRGQILENSLNGLLLKINDREVWTKLIGNFNGYNLLTIYGIADQLGLEPIEILQLISELNSVSGRFQYLISKQRITAIVDYAHTPDALKNVLVTINSIRTNNETLITVVGCGGDRDQEKRPIMGEIAASMSNKVIFTNDNPRTENPSAILEQIEKGVSPQDYKKVLTITDRKQAIRTACQLADQEDIILIAGKGHENYQETNGERIEFDDFEIVKEELDKMGK